MTTYFMFWFGTAAWSLLIRGRLGNLAIAFAVFLFIGLRYETGFDWPVYKDVFAEFEPGFNLDRLLEVFAIYGQELGFLVFMGLGAQVFPSYEWLQAIFTIAFILSLYRLCSAVPNARFAVALAFYFSFFMLAVGFATVRQAMAIAFFNFALAHWLEGRRAVPLAYAVLASFMQFSVMSYVVAVLVAEFLLSRKIRPKLRVLIPLALTAAAAFPLLLPLIVPFLGPFAARLQFYAELGFQSHFTTFNLAWILVTIGICYVATRPVRSSDGADAEKVHLLQGVIAMLGVLLIATTPFAVLRDRIGYGLLLLFCVFVSRYGTRWRMTSLFAVFAVGLLYQSLSFLRFPGVIAHVPYQNSIVMFFTGAESTGPSRSNFFLEEFIATFQ